MMEYTSKYWNMLTPLIKKSLRKRYGKAKTTQSSPTKPTRSTATCFAAPMIYGKDQPDGVESL